MLFSIFPESIGYLTFASPNLVVSDIKQWFIKAPISLMDTNIYFASYVHRINNLSLYTNPCVSLTKIVPMSKLNIHTA